MFAPFSFIKRAGTPAPSLTSANFDLVDTLGGGSITLTGTNLSGITGASWGATACTVGTNTSTSVVLTMPAKAAGTYNLTVTTAGGTSNTLSIEAWDPGQDPSVTLFCEAPNYAITPSGLWTKRAGAASSPAEATNYPALGSGGVPDFDGVNDQLLTSTIENVFTSTTGASVGTFAVIFNADTAGTDTTPGYDSPGFFGDNGRGSIGCSFSTAGFIGYLTDGSYKRVAIPATTGAWHAALWRFGNTGMDAQVDGKDASGVAGFTTVASGAWSNGTGQSIAIGRSYLASGSRFFDGKMRAIVFLNDKCTNTFATKFLKWARVRHGVA